MPPSAPSSTRPRSRPAAGPGPRAGTRGPRASAPDERGGGLVAAVRTGLLAAVATWAIVVLPALVGWIAAPESSLGWFTAVSVGSALWFVGHGQTVVGDGVAVSVTPVLLLLLDVYVTARFARRLFATQREVLPASRVDRTLARVLVPGFVGGYVVAAAVIAVLALGGPVGPGLLAVAGAALVPLAAVGALLLRPDDDDAPGFVRAWFRRGPTWLPAVWRIGWRGAGVLLLLGAAVVVARVVLTVGSVVSMQADYRVNLVGAAVLVAGQLLMLGNAATWALGFVAGPGFSLAAGSVVSPVAADPGLNPAVPLLAALPEQAAYPPLLLAVVLLPVLVGALLGRWVDAALEFFGNTRARFAAVATAAALAVVVVLALTALANGALGVERLAAVGVPLAPFVPALLAEVVGGACLWVGLALLRERRAERDAAAATDGRGDADDDDDADDDVDGADDDRDD
ncbi:DUF6350 family protein [Terracoccus luteus]|uniref:cell division protein PerM n=1 Tax=Terracoccus luteus TaxID=53356 RepID=UPI0011C3D033|nr:DUF6350 family protein [Terracoccus luteus]